MQAGTPPHLVISSPSNERVKALRRLHRARGRSSTGFTLLEGPTLVEAAVAAGTDVEIWSTGPDGDVRISEAVLGAISTTSEPQSPVGLIEIPDPAEVRTHATVVLWEVRDPGNAGTIIRTAAALGWDVGVTPGTVDVWSPKVLRAGAGAHFSTRIATVGSIESLQDTGLATVAAVASGGEWPVELSEPVALIVGSEPHGLPAELIAKASAAVTLPLTPATESLNVAVAAGILMWELGPKKGPALRDPDHLGPAPNFS